ncbi:MAG: hypothetical protein D6771_09420 [Zetaproteobacteria bacterium]|nr:MAG: hypothetical protein D6771_09420 [Zetaproteobacteria bacterium]
MKRALILLAVGVAGAAVNLWPGAHPDPLWPQGIAVGAVLARRDAWRWALPLAAVGDAALLRGVPLATGLVLAALVLPWIDARLGASLAQRMPWPLALALGLGLVGLGWAQALATGALSVWAWWWLGERR